jgi:hypothetical protein
VARAVAALSLTMSRSVSAGAFPLLTRSLAVHAAQTTSPTSPQRERPGNEQTMTDNLHDRSIVANIAEDSRPTIE